MKFNITAESTVPDSSKSPIDWHIQSNMDENIDVTNTEDMKKFLIGTVDEIIRENPDWVSSIESYTGSKIENKTYISYFDGYWIAERFVTWQDNSIGITRVEGRRITQKNAYQYVETQKFY